jgi:hypothetical protein
VTGLGQQGEAVGRSRPATVHGFLIFAFFYIFRNSYQLQKCIENEIKLRKNTKQNYVESLGVDLGISLTKFTFVLYYLL